ncbi:MAG: polyphosphate kinase 1 [Gammaproteobacteria bacterium]|nr:polyphosphate kinase 1 [Gammaproteobacteria bacterium]
MNQTVTVPSNPPAKTSVDWAAPELYINRELSLLEFNRRVLEHAKDPSNPLLERMQFLCICCRNMDEFFEVRVAGVKKRVRYGSTYQDADGHTASELLVKISATAHGLVADQYAVLNEALLPALAAENIRFLKRDECGAKRAAWVKRYFDEEVLALLTPMGLDPAHPFPRVLNKNLNFIVTLSGTDAFGRLSKLAIVQVPRSLPRVIPLPERKEGHHDFVFLSSVIHAHVGSLFPGMKVTGCYQFRVTRDADLMVDNEEVDDLLRALEGELPDRRFGEQVRLEVDDTCPGNLRELLRNQFDLDNADIYQVKGPVNLARLQAIHGLIERPDLKWKPFTPGLPDGYTRESNIFTTLDQRDLILHHPFESFTPVIDMLRQAAADPKVLAIKQTLYRTGPASALVDALVGAARGGKEVTVIIELRARFDEEANIALANRLHEAGAHVAYGVVGYKTHAKMLLVVRREERGLRRYVHLGTGNYHQSTARLYTDYGLMTSDAQITEDVHKLFHQLTGLGRVEKLKKLLQSPFTLHKSLLEHIAREARHAAAGKPAHIIAKMNALTETRIIRALYEASQAGVSIDLIVRGACCLRPNMAGVSENIRVRSVVGRFLEHTRLFYFENAGESEIYAASADWMDRNLFQRVETCFPIIDKKLAKRVLEQGLMQYLADNTNAWVMDKTGYYARELPSAGRHARSVQTDLLESLAT